MEKGGGQKDLSPLPRKRIASWGKKGTKKPAKKSRSPVKGEKRKEEKIGGLLAGARTSPTKEENENRKIQVQEGGEKRGASNPGS